MEKQDITQHSEKELSLLVFNTESLYNLRPIRLNQSRILIYDILSELFLFTDEQFEVLIQDVDADFKENSDEYCNVKNCKCC